MCPAYKCVQIFFLIQTITGAYMVINLFIAFLVGAFQSAEAKVSSSKSDDNASVSQPELVVPQSGSGSSVTLPADRKNLVQVRVY